jgi:PBP1b-binding outer membrane lipoprotein LpoB
MKNHLPARLAATLGASLLLAGCAGVPPAPDVSRAHPANPQAEASPRPSLKTGLLDFAGSAIPAPAEKSPTLEHHHGHQP